MVMRAALAMLDTATEHTITDLDVEIPDEAGPEQWACPLNLGPTTDDTLSGRLASEIARLRPWAAQTRTDRGRTLFGASGATAEQVDDVAEALAAIAESGNVTGDPPEINGIEWAFDMPLLVRHLADDLRTFYHEAIAAQPGPGAPNHDALNNWIFAGTAFGDTLQQVADHLTEADTPLALLTRGLTIPEGHYRGGSAFAATSEFGAEN